MDTKEPFLTKRQLIMGIILGIFAFSVNLGVIYFQDEIKIQCLNGTIEIHYKSNLSKDLTICGNPNIYIYNDNSGFGFYLPNEMTKNYAKSLNFISS